MSSNLPLIRRSHRVLLFLLNFPCMAEEGHKLELEIKDKQIVANSKGGLIIEGDVLSSEYGTTFVVYTLDVQNSKNTLF